MNKKQMKELAEWVAVYRTLCDDVNNAWMEMLKSYPGEVDGKLSDERVYWRTLQGMIKTARGKILELALDGRSEMPS